MNDLFLWLTPPFVGAIIGYVTNAIAIKMLFRPHRAVRIFGFRLPFTPGILPRQRHKLADSIGDMVERELLTPEVLRVRLLREDTRENVRAAVAAQTGMFLDLPLTKISAANNELVFFGTEIFREVFRTRNFEELLDKCLDILIDDTRPRFEGIRSRRIRDILGAEGTEYWIKTLEGIIRGTIPSLASRIPEGFIPAFDRNFPRLAEVFLQFLRRPEIHEALEVQGRLFLDNAIFKLNAVQRFFISAGQYDKTLRERMPELIDDLIGHLEELLEDREIRGRIRSFMLASFQGLLMTEASSAELAALIAGWLRTGFDRPLGEVLEDFDHADLRRVMRRTLSFLIREKTEQSEGILGRAFRGFLEEHRDMTLGKFLLISPERKAALDSLLRDKLLALADMEIGSVLQTIRIRTLVSERIDSLEMKDVEHIVLDVMANQLKWINLFGGLLGAILGVFQSFFSHFFLAGP